MIDKQEELVDQISGKLQLEVEKAILPPQGMDSSVLVLLCNNGKGYVVKVGGSTDTDIKAYRLIDKYNIKIPVPQIYLTDIFNGLPVLVMEKIKKPLLEVVMGEDMISYLPSIIETLFLVHNIKSKRSTPLSNDTYDKGWKQFHLSKFDGSDESFKWNEIAQRDSLDGALLLRSVERYIFEFSKVKYEEGEYSLLHNDYNQRNIFVNPRNKKVAGIIDWGDSIFGDPIYDFSRVRMLLWHYDFGKEVVERYYKLMRYLPQQRKIDDLYLVSRIIEYLAYYSRKVDDFSLPRIKRHEEFLKNLDWESL